MHFHFRNLAASNEPLQFHQQVDVSQTVKGDPDVKVLQPLQADLKAAYKGPDDSVDVQGKLSVLLEMACSRCLKPVRQQLDIPFHEQFKLVNQLEENQDEDDETIYVVDEEVDLVPYVEESFLLHLPLTIVCKESCKGLCPTCGTDLNEGTCSCDNEVVDPRLAALKDFFK